jgi:hypothetical protein
MIMKIIHADHGITPHHAASIQFAIETENPSGFFIMVIPIDNTCPPGLKCSLRGPSVGDDPIEDKDAYMAIRGDRKGPSRMTNLPPLEATDMVAIGTKDGEEVTLFTAYGTVGGAVAPREPWDHSLNEEEVMASRAFWAEHALSDN